MFGYVFTEWDPTATSDMEALASVFDTDGDGELLGAELGDFRIMVTNADGTTTSHTLTALGITSINLTAGTRRTDSISAISDFPNFSSVIFEMEMGKTI